MKIFSTRISFPKLVAPTLLTFVAVTLTTVNGCSQSDRSTGSREEVITQNALEAEAAEANLGSQKGTAKTAEKTAHAEKSTKLAKSESGKKHSKETHHKESKEAKVAARDPAPEAKTEASKGVRKPAAAGGAYIVHVGAFKLKENAEKLFEKLHQAGYPVKLETLDHSKNGLLHLIRFEPTANRSEAEGLIKDLSAKQALQARIITTAAEKH